METLDENEDTIAAAKEIMKKQGASYQNIYFDSDSEAGKLALSVMTFPTSVLIDSEGNIVGDVIVGGLDNEKTMASVQKQIDEILANKKNTMKSRCCRRSPLALLFFAVLIVSKINKVRTPAVATAPHALPSSTAPFRHPYYTHK